MQELRTRKEICYLFKIERTTLWRYEKEGCPVVGGRISMQRFAWWLEQRDAAKKLGIATRKFLAMPREAREHLLAAAVVIE